jgi:hypothetical protein
VTDHPNPGVKPEQEMLPGIEPATPPSAAGSPPMSQPTDGDVDDQESFDREDEDAFFAMEDGGEPIVDNEPELVTGMGGGDDPIVDGIEIVTDLEERPWMGRTND